MRIHNTNFNPTTIPYQAWRNTWLPLFHKQVQSLYDWLTWYNPDWDVINSITNWRNNIPGMSTDLTQIPSVDTPFKNTIQLEIQQEVYTVDLFDVTELEALQGFYNDSINNSGVLVYRPVHNSYWDEYIIQTRVDAQYDEIIEVAREATTYLGGTPQFFHNVGTTNFYVNELQDDNNFRNALNSCLFIGIIDTANPDIVSTADLEDSLACNFSNPNYFYVFVFDEESDTTIRCYRGLTETKPYTGIRGTILENLLLSYNETTQHWEITDPEHTGSEAAISRVTYNNISSLPTGFCCIAKWQPTGRDATTNYKHYTLDNYYIWPLGNGGFYSIQTNSNKMIANYLRNDYEKFINRNYFQIFEGTARYYVEPSQANIVESQSVKSLNSYSILFPVGNILKTNYWLGDQTLVPYTYQETTERISSTTWIMPDEVFFDSSFKYDTEAINSTLVNTFTYYLNTQNPWNNLKIGVF